ncbi:hypothetical protein MIMGU_mgv1a020624mg, partial [Erythranthe guttata]
MGVGQLVPEVIWKEEAICRLCFKIYQEHMLQTKCKCEFAMIHESCGAEWSQKKGHNKCDICEQDIQNIPVMVSLDHLSSTRNKELKRGSTLK